MSDTEVYSSKRLVQSNRLFESKRLPMVQVTASLLKVLKDMIHAGN